MATASVQVDYDIYTWAQALGFGLWAFGLIIT